MSDMLMLAFIGLIGVMIIYQGHRSGRLAATLDGTTALSPDEAHWAAASLSGRLATVRGRAAPLQASQPAIAPLSERPCAWWALRVRPHRRLFSLRARAGMLVLPREHQSGSGFAIVDGTRRVRVEPSDLVTYGHPPSTEVREPQPGLFSPAVLPPVTRRIVRRFRDLDDLVHTMSLRRIDYTEWTLEEGERVAVTGELGVDTTTGDPVIRRHRPQGRRTKVFGMTPGRDHTDATDLRRQQRRSLLIGSALALFGFGLVAAGLPELLTDLGEALREFAGRVG